MAVPLAHRRRDELRRTLDQRMTAREGPAASRRRSELTAQSGVDKFDVLWVATDVCGGERAGGNDGPAAGPDVIERGPDQHAAQSFALPSLVDLGVGDDDAVAGGLVLRPSDQRAVDAQLESAIARVVLHAPAHRVTVARAARSARDADAARPVRNPVPAGRCGQGGGPARGADARPTGRPGAQRGPRLVERAMR